MITNQISDWYAAPQTVTVDDMTGFGQDLYQRIAQIAYGKVPCIIALNGSIEYYNNPPDNLFLVTIPQGCFIFNETNYNFLTYQTFPMGIAQKSTIDVSSLRNGYIVARYSIDPIIPNQTSYKINTSYQFTTNINNDTDVLICTIQDNILFQNGKFLFPTKQYNLNNLLRFHLNTSSSVLLPYRNPSITYSNDFCSIVDIVDIGGANKYLIKRSLDGASFDISINFGADNPPVELDEKSVFTESINNTIKVCSLSKNGQTYAIMETIPNVSFNYVCYKKIYEDAYFFGRDNISNKGISITGRSDSYSAYILSFCSIIFDIVYYNNKYYVSTDNGVYSGSSVQASTLSLIGTIVDVASYYFKLFNHNGNNIILLINNNYAGGIGVGTTTYYYISNDGITFTKRTPTFSTSNEEICNIENNGKVFVAITKMNNSNQHYVYTSLDGIDWLKINTSVIPDKLSTGANIIYKLKYINNKFLLMQFPELSTQHTIQIYCSEDGLTWSKSNINLILNPYDFTNQYNLYNGLFYFNGVYQFFGYNNLNSFILSERG